MASKDQNEYVYISKLDELTSDLSATDNWFIVSNNSEEKDGKPVYTSNKVGYQAIQTQLYDYLSAYMVSLTDREISSNVNALSSMYGTLSSLVDACLSAVVALDNCRNNVRDRVADLEQRVEALEH